MEVNVLEKAFVPLVAVAALVPLLAGCQGGSAGPVVIDTDSMSDRAGDEPLPSIVRIKSVDRAPDGTARYVVANISGRDQEDLAYFISFFFPSPPEEDDRVAIKKLGDRETTPQRDLVLLRGTEREISAQNPRPGAPCLGTTIDVVNNEAVPVVMRADTAGTLFLNKSLECVAMSGEDDLRVSKKLWLEFENVSGRPVSEIEAKAQFHDPGAANAKVAETKWMTLRDVQPQQRTRVEFDLSALPRLSNTIFLVKIRQQSL